MFHMYGRACETWYIVTMFKYTVYILVLFIYLFVTVREYCVIFANIICHLQMLLKKNSNHNKSGHYTKSLS